jgi:hypothetical protein
MNPPFLILILVTFLSACNQSGEEVQPDPVNPPIGETLITVSGKITYDSVPVTSVGLNYLGIIRKPLRKIYLEIVNANTDKIISSTTTGYDGSYSFTYSSSISKIYIRIRAEIKSPSVLIIDNTNGDAVYVVESVDYSVSQDTSLPDINLASGWSTSTNSYSSSRVSAPFAILDVVLSAADKVAAAKQSLVFPPLKINWSVNNTSESGSKSLGKIRTTHYSSFEGEIYILGKANVDTDEFDSHVIVHEWGHYFEDKMSRSDSIGGQHGYGDDKDMTLAFSEGWGNAFSAMILDPLTTYVDTMGQGQGTIRDIFSLELSSDPNPGWFSEVSVQEILFDLYDSTNGSSDGISMGISPIIDVLTSHQKDTRALTSIFSFINGLKIKYSSSSSEINNLISSKSISIVMDDYGTGETNNGGWIDNLPVFRSLVVGGNPTTSSLRGAGLIYNDLGNNRLFKFTATGIKTLINFTSADSYFLEVMDGKEIIRSFDEEYIGSQLRLVKEPVTTVPGKVYIIRIQTHGPLVTSPDFFNFTIDID